MLQSLNSTVNVFFVSSDVSSSVPFVKYNIDDYSYSAENFAVDNGIFDSVTLNVKEELLDFDTVPPLICRLLYVVASYVKDTNTPERILFTAE